MLPNAYGQTSCCASRQMTAMVGRLLTLRFLCGISASRCIAYTRIRVPVSI